MSLLYQLGCIYVPQALLEYYWFMLHLINIFNISLSTLQSIERAVLYFELAKMMLHNLIIHRFSGETTMRAAAAAIEAAAT